MRLPRRLEHGHQVALIGHLEEFRSRLFVAGGAILVTTIFAFVMHRRVIALLVDQLPIHHRHLLTLGVAEPFTTSMKVSLALGFALALPIVLWQLWSFVAPAMTPKTQRGIAGFTVFDTEIWGELGMRSFLRTFGVSDEVSSRAAAGWGGDRAVVLAHEGETNARKMIAVARFEWDTEIDAREAQAALEHALDAMTVGATMDQTMERTRWLGLDGTVSWIERKGPSVVMVIGAPLTAKLDPWTFLKRGR